MMLFLFLLCLGVFAIYGFRSDKDTRDFYYYENIDPESPSFDTNYKIAPSINGDVFKYIRGKKKTVNQQEELRVLKKQFVIFHLLLLLVMLTGYLYKFAWLVKILLQAPKGAFILPLDWGFRRGLRKGINVATFEETILEACASTSSNEIIYYTIEMHHPALEVPVWLVQGNNDIRARLEKDTLSHAGKIVEFIGAPWDMPWPSIEEDRGPKIVDHYKIFSLIISPMVMEMFLDYQR